MTKIWKPIALAALALTGACSSFRFEPTADWLHEGGSLCAADREGPHYDWDRAAPRTCAQALGETPQSDG